MLPRKLFTWKTSVQAETGAIVERPLKAYWDPAKVSATEIAAASAAEAFIEHDKQVRFAPISAELVADE